MTTRTRNFRTLPSNIFAKANRIRKTCAYGAQVDSFKQKKLSKISGRCPFQRFYFLFYIFSMAHKYQRFWLPEDCGFWQQKQKHKQIVCTVKKTEDWKIDMDVKVSFCIVLKLKNYIEKGYKKRIITDIRYKTISLNFQCRIVVD